MLRNPQEQTAYYGALVANKTWLTRTEVADYLGISPSMVDRQLRHVLPTYQIVKGSKAYVFKKEEVDAWIESNRVAPTDEYFIS
jgi:excisionase family DNA binding protein